ncbi:MAG: D-alanine--D-alanine ligase, partial [Synergistaceae bacterium]|nr:D-alanine--D-alanine ligase [Synergistaceae bacterium]
MFNGKKVAVLCGGDGREREVSLRSGRAVCDALNEAGIFNAELIDLRSMNEIDAVKNFDGVFIAMHGDWGEGGDLQAKLEAMKIPFTGSNSAASARAMNKITACELFKSENIKTPDGLVWSGSCDEIISRLGRDLVVKPSSGGSTVGITIIKDAAPEKISEAVNLAKESYVGDVLIEKYIEGREITAAVWERNGRVEALPLIEIVPHHGFYDSTNKYTKGATEYIVPAKIDSESAKVISEMAVKAHEVLGCSGYSRADFRLAPDGEAYILEVNTAPGMTATSLVPKAAGAVGVSMPRFVSEIMRMA